MFRKPIILAQIALLTVGTALARAPMEAPTQHPKPAIALHSVDAQNAPRRIIRFKASRAVHLRTADARRPQRATIA
jgi:hypothetical protein